MKSFRLNIKGTLHRFEQPVVMGILNITPDSFFDGGHFTDVEKAGEQVDKMRNYGALIIDIGASSSRPGSIPVEVNEELDRVLPVVEWICKYFPNLLISIDTFRASVAEKSVLAGAHIVNDISAGDDDINMLSTVGKLKVPYIAMHKKGNTFNMQQNPVYEDVTAEVCGYFGRKLAQFNENGIHDVIIDPGFGFGKSIAHNYQLLRDLPAIQTVCNRPILVGVSRKSMISKVVGGGAKDALNGTTSVNTLALIGGAHILRVHDVKEAMECIEITQHFLGTI